MMWLSLSLAVALSVQSSSSQEVQSKSLTDVTGVWVMLVAGHQIGLELEQKGSKVEGIMHAMGRRILLVGEYADRQLTLKGERPEDQLTHGDAQAGPITATMLDDGTMEGELSTNKGRTRWTGERFKAGKPSPQASIPQFVPALPPAGDRGR
jgi:hypothetical protein